MQLHPARMAEQMKLLFEVKTALNVGPDATAATGGERGKKK